MSGPGTFGPGGGGKGRSQRAGSARGQNRLPNLDHYYRHRLASVTPGDFEFRLLLVRPDADPGHRRTDLTRHAIQFGWNDDSAVLSGSVTLRRPNSSEDQQAFPILPADRVRCFVFWRDKWYELWEMGVSDAPDTDPVTGQIDVNLADDLIAADQDEFQWDYRKDKAHPKGWTADEIAVDAAKKDNVPVGKIAKAETPIEKLALKGSVLDIVKAAYAKEHDATGRTFVIRFRKGRFEVVSFKRNRVLYEIAGAEEDATTTTTYASPHPHTIIKATGHLGKPPSSSGGGSGLEGADAEGGESGGSSSGGSDPSGKIEVTITAKRAMKRLGRSTLEKDYGRVKSRAELKKQATIDLWKELKATRSAQLSVAGVPFLRRADTVRWITTEVGWHGHPTAKTYGPKYDTEGNPLWPEQDLSFGFVKSVEHSVTSRYVMTVSIDQVDPYVLDREARDKIRREQKKKASSGKGTNDSSSTRPSSSNGGGG